MKGTKIFTISLMTLFVCSSLSFVQPVNTQKQQTKEKELDKLLKDWLKSPIKYIITKEEKKAYKLKLKLKKRDEQLRYIEFFWRRRDPTPKTPRNEFRAEFFKRLALSEKNYKIGKKPGWESQRGQITIVFGPPSETQRGIRSETWQYYSLPTDKLPQNLSIIFRDIRGNNDYRIANIYYPGKDAGQSYMDSRAQRALTGSLPSEIVQGIEDINKLTIVNKQLKFEDIPPPPKSLTQPSTTKPRPKPPTGKMRPISEAPFDLQQSFFQSEDTRVEMLLGFSYRYGDVTFKEEDGTSKASLNIKAFLMDKDKNNVDSFEQELSILLDPLDLKSKENERFYFYQSLKATPGKYQFIITSEDKNKRTQDQLKSEVEIPDLASQELFLSNIITADEILVLEKEPEETEGVINSMRMMGYKIMPNLKAVYKTGSPFCLFFQLEHFKVDEQTSKPQAEIFLHIFTTDKKHFKSIKFPDENLTSRKPGEILTSHCFPLTAFSPGEYFLIIQAKDKIAKKETAKRLSITIQE